jgi:DNA-binding response OmpR family regulator
MRILLVDDNSDFRSYVWSGLTRKGIACERASDAASAKSLLDRSGTTPFDLVLLDIRMPGETGWDLLREMRDEGRETPVLLLTGLDAVENRLQSVWLGADDYMTKDFEFDDLLTRIGAVLGRRRPREDRKLLRMSPREPDFARASA